MPDAYCSKRYNSRSDHRQERSTSYQCEHNDWIHAKAGFENKCS